MGREVCEQRYQKLMFLKKPDPVPSSYPCLSPGDIEIVDEIRSECDRQAATTHLTDAQIVDLALRLLRRAIDGGLEAEVLEEMRRETGYRRWCAANSGETPGNSTPRDGGLE